MKRTCIIFFICLFSFGCTSKPKKHVINYSKTKQTLFVISGSSGTVKENTLTLKNVPLVVYFMQQSNGVAGHMSVKQFESTFNEEKQQFTTSAPIGILSIIRGNKAKNYSVNIQDTKVTKGEIVFHASYLNNTIPESFKEASLFISFDVRDWNEMKD